MRTASPTLRFFLMILLICLSGLLASAQSTSANVDWPKVNEELLRHFQALIRIDTTDPPGNETKAVEYIKQFLEAEGISVTIAAKDPARANLIARIKGNGSKRPILLMGHTDTVTIDASKWKFPPFSAERDGGYIYGRGTLDNKWQVAAGMMTMILLKRGNVALDRDVIFVAEVGEEAATGPGIEYLMNERWADIDAEYCLAEGGGVTRKDGRVRFAGVQTGEKRPNAVRLISNGPAGHGSRPIRTNALVHLSGAVERIAAWEPPMRLNDTTRTYFEKLATISTPEEAERYNGLLNPAKSAASREYLAEHEPGNYSLLHTSVSPNIITGGYQVNVIPSQAEATLDVRSLPDENMPEFLEMMRKVINDPAIQIVTDNRNQRPGAAPSRIDSEVYKAVEAAYKKTYNAITIPEMSTGATDMAFLRAKGMQCYGIGPGRDEEDAALGFGSHSDQERIREDEVLKFLQLQWDVLSSVATSKR
jgi:acetylornithine deacetylase/succinyl-diaminopimelate desuccinylase-like protein